MTADQAIAELDAMKAGGDKEADHGHADEILLAVLDELAPRVAAAYRRADDRADGWWYA